MGIISDVIIGGSLIVGIIQLILLRKQLKGQHDWNRRVTALQFSFSEQPEMREIRARLAKKLGLFTRPPGEISLKEIQKLENEDPAIRGDLQYVLGRLTAMCAAINNNIVDEQVCKDLQKGSVIRYFRFFRQYVDDVRTLSNNQRVYECLEQYAKKWEQEDSPQAVKRESTG
ncbi:DUF4760 domain-containing protein [Desulfobulbus sp. F4]|nr:DUF4760 domain-containing protein [Desulfobulbus sp. F4]